MQAVWSYKERSTEANKLQETDAKIVLYRNILRVVQMPHYGNGFFRSLGPNVSTTPIMAMGCRQCLPLSVVQLKGKHCPKPHCHNGVVNTFGQCYLNLALHKAFQVP